MRDIKKNKIGFKFQVLSLKKLFWLRVCLVTLFYVVLVTLPEITRAEGASLSIYPQTGSFTVGSTFDVSVFVNTGGKNVNAVKVDLKFDPEKLQVVTPAKGLSAVAGWIFPPSFSSTKGEISLQGGFVAGGINTSEGLISIIVFEAISTGKVEVNFLDSSKVLVGEEEGTNILTSLNRGTYEILLPPSKGPKIFSESHPDQNRWYKNNSPVFSWEKIEGTTDYSYKLDDDFFGEPDNVVDTESSSVSFEGVGDGISYFHLKSKKEDVWGGASHYSVKIDATPPLQFEPNLEPFSFAGGNYLIVYFNTSDSLSGMDHYEVRIVDLTDPENVSLSGWAREESPFRLGTEKSGIFRILVRAFDEAGNFQEGKIQVRIFSPPLIVVGGGVQVRGLFVPWWLVYVFSGLIIIFIGIKIYSLLRKRNLARRLKREVAEAEKEIEDVKKLEKRIGEMRVLEEEAGKEAERLTERLKGKE